MPASRVLASALALLVTIPSAAQPKADPPADRVPVLKPLWKITTIGRSADEYPRNIPDNTPFKFQLDEKRQLERAIDWATKLYADVITARRAAARPLIPPFVPTGTETWVIYQNNEGLAARALTAVADGDHKAGELHWASQFPASLSVMAGAIGNRATVDQWARAQDPTDQVWSRTLAHEIVVQGDTVYAVDDLAFLRPPQKTDGLPPAFGTFRDAVHGGCLRWINVGTGKLQGRVGPTDSEPDRPAVGGPPAPKDQPTPGIRFPSSPLPGPGHLTFLTERNRSLWLTRLDVPRFTAAINRSSPWGNPKAHREALTKEATWELELMVGSHSLVQDPYRRIHAIHLVESGGLVICPTHLGRVIAVDAKTGKAKWTHEYAPLQANRFSTFAPEWVVVPPVVADGKYVYAPADFPELLGLDPATGNKLWGTQKGDGLYPAVVGDTVLVVGEKIVRGLSLKDGAGMWRVDLPGLPCGRGVMLGSDYLVPVSEPKTWKGMIAVIDVKAGKVREVLKAGDEPIGNLVVHQDFLISQTLTELVVFPIKKRD
ncbi:MAG TPA: PQQ-binding-like beta-propeller repeat protein [Gemmataceae bacterium]|nr:PQQ-binding-like beta-propeller repeat protein [Gemmataceae bacterium]